MSGLNYKKLGSTLSNICNTTQLDDATLMPLRLQKFLGRTLWGLLALYKHTEILGNSSLKVTNKSGYGHLKIQVSDPGPSWPSCLISC